MAWGGIKTTSADRHFSKCIRLAQEWRCELCGKQCGPTIDDYRLECAHIRSRARHSTRFLTANALALCTTCHRNTGDNVREHEEWVVDNFGQARIDLIDFKARGILKPTKQNLKMVSDHYRLEFNRMTKTGSRDLVSW